VLRRPLIVLVVCLAAAGLSSPASVAKASNKPDLGQAQNGLAKAQAEATQLGKDIGRERSRLADLQGQIAGLQGDIAIASADYDNISSQLAQTQSQQSDVEKQAQTVRDQMDARARESYIDGPVAGLQFLLDSTSITDLSNRTQFIGALQAQDANNAERLSGLEANLHDIAKQQQALKHVKAMALKDLQTQESDLATRQTDAQDTLATLQQNLAHAKALESKYQHQVQVAVKALGGTGGPSPFFVCPVPHYSAIGDDFGAIRYTTVPPHFHAGNDIMAPMGAEILAPFPGVATNSSNGLGGNAVSVKGAAGYVYNAHLSRFGKLGHVNTGDVIGYVGNTGDAAGGPTHDHFEWHPNNTGGEHTINGAIDPHPGLLAVC
jgi:murein DD-endopeptidase MepM/ murein hydrolase activator NlpD